MSVSDLNKMSSNRSVVRVTGKWMENIFEREYRAISGEWSKEGVDFHSVILDDKFSLHSPTFRFYLDGDEVEVVEGWDERKINIALCNLTGRDNVYYKFSPPECDHSGMCLCGIDMEKLVEN